METDFKPKTAQEQDAFQLGDSAGYVRPGCAVGSPYDGRTRLGKAWWAGFLAGDQRRCVEGRTRSEKAHV